MFGWKGLVKTCMLLPESCMTLGNGVSGPLVWFAVLILVMKAAEQDSCLRNNALKLSLGMICSV